MSLHLRNQKNCCLHQGSCYSSVHAATCKKNPFTKQNCISPIWVDYENDLWKWWKSSSLICIKRLRLVGQCFLMHVLILCRCKHLFTYAWPDQHAMHLSCEFQCSPGPSAHTRSMSVVSHVKIHPSKVMWYFSEEICSETSMHQSVDALWWTMRHCILLSRGPAFLEDITNAVIQSEPPDQYVFPAVSWLSTGALAFSRPKGKWTLFLKIKSTYLAVHPILWT